MDGCWRRAWGLTLVPRLCVDATAGRMMSDGC